MDPTREPPSIPSDHLQPLLRLARRTLRHAWVALPAIAAVAAATFAFAELRPKQYRSEAVAYYREGLQWTANEAMSTRRIGQRLKDMLLARSQLARVIEELGLYPKLVRAGRMADAVEEMRAATGFKVERDSDVFVISFAGDSPEEAQRVTAKLAEVLIGENMRLRADQAEVAREFLDAEKKRNEVELAGKEAEQLRFLAEHPEFAHEQSTTLGVSMRAKARSGAGGDAVVPKGDALSALRREEARLRRQLSAPGHVPAPQDPTLVAAKNEAEAKLRAAQRELGERRARFTEEHPDVRTAAVLAREAEEAYQRAVAALEGAPPTPAPSGGDVKEQLARVQQEIAAYTRNHPKQKAAAGEAVETSDAAKRIVELESEWTRLNREVAEARERFQQLDTKQFMASMTASMLMSGQTAQIVLIDPAYLPAQPLGMATKRLALVGVALALALGALMAILAALLDDRIADRVDVDRLELAPVLVEVPGMPGAQRRGRSGGADRPRARRAELGLAASFPRLLPDAAANLARTSGEPLVAAVRDAQAAALVPVVDASVGVALRGTALDGAVVAPPRVRRVAHVPPAGRGAFDLVMLDAPDSEAAAAFRVLRHRLTERGGVTTVLVTSASAAEGKSTTAVNLALALGEAGRARVLLLEANFHAPALARLLGFEPPPRAGDRVEYGGGAPARPWIVVETVAPWLHAAALAPGEGVRPTIQDPALAAYIDEQRRAGYDWVVVDGPAILGSADVNAIEESVDGVLVTVRARTSRARALRRAVEQVGTAKLLGIALLEA